MRVSRHLLMNSKPKQFPSDDYKHPLKWTNQHTTIQQCLRSASHLSDSGIFSGFTSLSALIICQFTLAKPISVRHLMSSLLVALLVYCWYHVLSTARQHSFEPRPFSFSIAPITQPWIWRCPARVFQEISHWSLSATASHTRSLIGLLIFSWANEKGTCYIVSLNE